MKILVISQYFWPENFRINDLAEELYKRGHEITVLTGVPNYPEGKIFQSYLDNKKYFNEFHGIEVIRVPMLSRGNTKLSLFFNYLTFMLSAIFLGPLKLRRKNFDIIFVCQLSPATVALPGVVISKLKKAPLVMWVLDLWPDSLKAVGVIQNQTVLLWLQRLMNFIYLKCSLILVQSNSFKLKISNLVDATSKIHYIPTWAENSFTINNNNRVDLERKNQDFIVTFAGNIGSAQDMDCILNAAIQLRKYPNIKFNLLGDGRDAKRVAQLIKDNKLQQNVKMLGRHPLEAMPNFFANSDALLVTLADEEIFAMTVPGKLQSYLAFGKPILGALNGEDREVIQDSMSGYCVASGDFDGLATAILRMSRLTTSDRLVMGQNGRTYYESVFDRSIIINKFEEILLTLILK